MPSYPKDHHIQLEATAKMLLRDARGRSNETLFRSICMVWYAEREHTGSMPRLDLARFGLYLGLEDKQIARTRNACRLRIETLRRQKDDIDATIDELQTFLESLSTPESPRNN